MISIVLLELERKIKEIINSLELETKSNDVLEKDKRSTNEKEKIMTLIIKMVKIIIQSFDIDKCNRDIRWLISKEHFKGENRERCPYLNLKKDLDKNDKMMVGNDRDKNGCIPSAGYVWCEKRQKCIRLWEENK